MAFRFTEPNTQPNLLKTTYTQWQKTDKHMAELDVDKFSHRTFKRVPPKPIAPIKSFPIKHTYIPEKYQHRAFPMKRGDNSYMEKTIRGLPDLKKETIANKNYLYTKDEYGFDGNDKQYRKLRILRESAGITDDVPMTAEEFRMSYDEFVKLRNNKSYQPDLSQSTPEVEVKMEAKDAFESVLDEFDSKVIPTSEDDEATTGGKYDTIMKELQDLVETYKHKPAERQEVIEQLSETLAKSESRDDEEGEELRDFLKHTIDDLSKYTGGEGKDIEDDDLDKSEDISKTTNFKLNELFTITNTTDLMDKFTKEEFEQVLNKKTLDSTTKPKLVKLVSSLGFDSTGTKETLKKRIIDSVWKDV